MKIQGCMALDFLFTQLPLDLSHDFILVFPLMFPHADHASTGSAQAFHPALRNLQLTNLFRSLFACNFLAHNAWRAARVAGGFEGGMNLTQISIHEIARLQDFNPLIT